MEVVTKWAKGGGHLAFAFPLLEAISEAIAAIGKEEKRRKGAPAPTHPTRTFGKGRAGAAVAAPSIRKV